MLRARAAHRGQGLVSAEPERVDVALLLLWLEHCHIHTIGIRAPVAEDLNGESPELLTWRLLLLRPESNRQSPA